MLWRRQWWVERCQTACSRFEEKPVAEGSGWAVELQHWPWDCDKMGLRSESRVLSLWWWSHLSNVFFAVSFSFVSMCFLKRGCPVRKALFHCFLYHNMCICGQSVLKIRIKTLNLNNHCFSQVPSIFKHQSSATPRRLGRWQHPRALLSFGTGWGWM